MSKLMDVDDVFRKYFSRWYSKEDLKNRKFKGSKPDIMSWAKSGSCVQDVCRLSQVGREKVTKYVDGMIDAAKHDFGEHLNLKGDPDLEWVNTIDEYYNREVILQLMKSSNPKNFNNQFLIICCEYGALLGYVTQKLNDSLVWLYDWPYWESSLYYSKTGHKFNVFEWGMKKFSEYGVDDGYKAKLLACNNFIRNELLNK